MRQGFKSEHWNDANGNPAGGSTFGNGFAISWQNGPLGACTCSEGFRRTVGGSSNPDLHERGCTRRAPNGAFVEDIIAAALDRLKMYQASRFACSHNERAVRYLEAALVALDERTREREQRKVEGTHKE